jgi:hypothetical protein
MAPDGQGSPERIAILFGAAARAAGMVAHAMPPSKEHSRSHDRAVARVRPPAPMMHRGMSFSLMLPPPSPADRRSGAVPRGIVVAVNVPIGTVAYWHQCGIDVQFFEMRLFVIRLKSDKSPLRDGREDAS